MGRGETNFAVDITEGHFAHGPRQCGKAVLRDGKALAGGLGAHQKEAELGNDRSRKLLIPRGQWLFWLGILGLVVPLGCVKSFLGLCS